MYANGAICAQKPPRVFHLYRREHRDQLSFKDFFLPFGGQLEVDCFFWTGPIVNL